ncbi:MAG: flap endonuclease-1 [Nanoarchaeota archaeon]|nr:flap endonuclease-1 [Nanoarchaeota archaeon]MBU0962859.1 flap endonuclease-1 [Nanoarchaeota archaeon]
MGVKLADLIIKNDISFEELKDRRIAVDFSNVVYQFLSNIRQADGTPLMDSNGKITSHLVGLFSRTANLMEKGIKICYVFDGKPPLLKIKEREEREHRKRIAESKLEKAREEESEEDVLKYSKQIVRLTPEIMQESKELISAMGLPVIQAPSEAEAQAAFMCEQEDVFACGSQDYDSLLFNSPKVIQNLTLSQKRRLPNGSFVWIKPQIIDLKENLEHLKLTPDQLLVIGILIGTDYNPGGVKGIGPKTALRLVQQNKNFDDIFKEVKADFNWKEIYAVFKSMPIMKNYQLKWHPVDEKKVRTLLINKHNFSEERVNNTLKKISNKDIGGLNKWV